MNCIEEYYKSKEPGRYNSDTRPGSFVIKPNCHQPMD